MKKIVFVLNNLHYGGVQRTVVNLCNELHQRMYQVEIVLLEGKASLADHLNGDIPVTRFNSNSYIRSLWMLGKFLFKREPEILFANLFVPNVLSLIAVRTLRIHTKVVLGLHNTLSKEKRRLFFSFVERAIIKYLFPFADGINICSQEAADDLAGTLNQDFPNLHVIYNPVITRKIDKLANENIDHPWFQQAGPPVILGIGRLTEQKDFATLIRAFNLLNARLDARLMILGDGPEMKNLIHLIKHYHLEDRVDLRGFVQNPYKYMAAASLFVLSSTYEGLPTVLIEANYLGCPIVSTSCKSGPKEILVNGKYGVLVPVGDPKEMAVAMEQQIHSPKKKADPNWVRMFTVNTVVDQYIKLYFD